MHVQLHMDAKCAFTIYLGGNGHASPATSPPGVCSHCSTCAHISVEPFASLLDTIFAKPLKEVLATTGFSLGAQRKYPTKHAHTNPSHWRPLGRAGNYLRQLFLELCRARALVMSRRQQGLPVAPNHSFLFGHLRSLKSVLSRLPPDVHFQQAIAEIAREHFSETGVFYLDLWPLSELWLVVVSPKVATQVTQSNLKIAYDRPKMIQRFVLPITGGPSLLDLDKKDWKPWRAIFNKGFRGDLMYSLVPHIVEEVQVFSNTLRGLAQKNEMAFLDPITLRFKIDVIGKTVLNAKINAQMGYNIIADTFLDQTQ